MGRSKEGVWSVGPNGVMKSLLNGDLGKNVTSGMIV